MLVFENKSIKNSTTIKSVETEFTGNYYLSFTTYNDKIMSNKKVIKCDTKTIKA